MKSYMDIHTRQEYPKELIQPEIKPENRTGMIEQLAQNVEAVEKQCINNIALFFAQPYLSIWEKNDF